ncbi:hypothetical protein ACIRN4_07045 [Pimelobacter simplex]|uniref:hypothetical protein n=1 Tax=Nocardioides simplex TaxID=2045 RepID=UPI003806C7A5
MGRDGRTVRVVGFAVEVELGEDRCVEQLAGVVSDRAVEPLCMTKQVDDLFQASDDLIVGDLGLLDEPLGVGDLDCDLCLPCLEDFDG